jgi:hypothetical protein
MDFKLLSALYSNELLLSILPFETGYLLVPDKDESIDVPCEHSVTLAMIIRSTDLAAYPYKEAFDEPYEN